MAPPTNKLRLSQLVPDDVAADIAKRSVEHVAHLTMSLLSLDALPLALGDPRTMEIYNEVRRFTYYATQGAMLEGDSVHECMISLIPLYQSVCGGDAAVDGISEDADPETPLGLVIRAGLARERIARGEAVSAVELAALSDLSDRQVRQLIRNGEIRASDGRISAKTATRFLSARQVPGF
jgi:hypothetical protein